MELNATLVVVLGFVVFGLGWLIKKKGWNPQGRRMLWAVVGISVIGGIVQVILSAQTAPFPPMPSEPSSIVFNWVPGILGWVAASAGAVFAASQIVYSIIMKGIAPQQ
jgi:type IV secretory pathway VirB2 component (pilin)